MANQLRVHLQTVLPGAVTPFRDLDATISPTFLAGPNSQDVSDWIHESVNRHNEQLRDVGCDVARGRDHPHASHILRSTRLATFW